MELAKAYNNVFKGNPTRGEQEMVLADLANHSGFYQVHLPSTAPAINFANGRRDVFGRIFRFLNMSAEEWKDLEIAARAEAVTDASEGHII